MSIFGRVGLIRSAKLGIAGSPDSWSVQNVGCSVRSVDAVDEVNGKIVIVGRPGEDSVTGFLHC